MGGRLFRLKMEWIYLALNFLEEVFHQLIRSRRFENTVLHSPFILSGSVYAGREE